MPTTTSTATIKRDELIKRALRRLGVDYPTVNQIQLAVPLLCDIVREIDTEGRWLWTISNTPSVLILVPAQRAYDQTGAAQSRIQPNIMTLEWIEIVQGTSRRPLQIITEYESISNALREQTVGQPYCVYLERAPQKVNQRMHFFPTPAAADTVNYTYRRQLYDFLLPTDNPDFPQDWNQALVKRLSFELSPEYGIPLQERETLHAEAKEAMRERLSANAETPTQRPQRTQFF
jgi:hypothetical protein